MTSISRLPAGLAHARARGVSLITAVFLLVGLSVLSAAMVRVYLAQQSGAALDLLGAQAYQAARSGLEWGMFQQLRVQPGAPVPTDCFDAPNTFAMPVDGALSAFSVTVYCTAKTGNAPGSTTNSWTIEAVACNRPGTAGCPNPDAGPEYVQRRVMAVLN